MAVSHTGDSAPSPDSTWVCLRGSGITSSITISVSEAIRSTMWLTLIACEMWLMKNSSNPTQIIASRTAPMTEVTGEKGRGKECAAGRVAMQYKNVPRNIPSVH